MNAPFPAARGRRGWRNPLKLAAGLLCGLVLTGFVAGLTLPEYLLYADRYRVNILALQDHDGFQPVDVATHDGLSLRAWYHPPEMGMPTIVYFPDRMGDFARKPAHLFELAGQGYGLMLSSYRGYGGNPGLPDEFLFYRDAGSLLALMEERQMAPGGMVIYGYSMGSAIASYAAAAVRPLGLILEAPFTSFADVVRYQVAPLPVWHVRTRFDNSARIGSVDVPILILAGELDRITPPSFAKRLAALSEGFSSLYVLPGANHLNIIRHGAGDIVTGFIGGLGQGRAALAGDGAS